MFDTVEIRRGGSVRLLSVEDYFQVPLRERIELMMTGNLRFYRDHEEVNMHHAMRASRSDPSPVRREEPRRPSTRPPPAARSR